MSVFTFKEIDFAVAAPYERRVDIGRHASESFG